MVFDVRRARLASGSEEDETNDDRDVPLLSESLPGAFGPAFAFVLALAFALVLAFAIFSDIKGVAAARSVFGGHVTVLLE